MENGYSTAESSFSSSQVFPPARAGDAPPLAAPAHLQNTPRLSPEIQLAQFLPEVKTDRRGRSKNVCYDSWAGKLKRPSSDWRREPGQKAESVTALVRKAIVPQEPVTRNHKTEA